VTYRERIKVILSNTQIGKWSQQVLLDDIMKVVEDATEDFFKQGKLQEAKKIPDGWHQLPVGSAIESTDRYWSSASKWAPANGMAGFQVSANDVIWIRKRS
jgi:hypothetical protein